MMGDMEGIIEAIAKLQREVNDLLSKHDKLSDAVEGINRDLGTVEVKVAELIESRNGPYQTKWSHLDDQILDVFSGFTPRMKLSAASVFASMEDAGAGVTQSAIGSRLSSLVGRGLLTKHVQSKRTALYSKPAVSG